MKKKLLTILLTLAATFCLCLGIAACGGNNQSGDDNEKEAVVPVYTGMTVSQDSARMMMAASLSSPLAREEANGEGEGQTPETEVEVPEVEVEDNTFETGVEDKVLPSITVETSDEVEYFAVKNTDIYINVHITNPSGYVILRFTLNGIIYQNYQFENGSDSELLILKVNTGDVCGIKDYTIDAIKYIDDADNLNKDVDMSTAEKTVKVGVTYDSLPEIQLGEVSTTTKQANIEVALSDTYSILGENEANVYLYDGESIIDTVPIVKGDNTVTFSDLTENRTYQYLIAATYDSLDGNGMRKVVLGKGEFKTKAYYALTSVTPGKESVSFAFTSNAGDKNVAFVCFALLNSEGTAVQRIDDIDILQFTNLRSDNDYTVALYYSYQEKGETVNAVHMLSTHTLPKATPTVTLTTSGITQTAFTFSITVTDADEVGAITSVKVNDTAKELTDRAFTGLLSNNDYTVEVVYTYDLNDGTGEQTLTNTIKAHTLPKATPTVEIENISSTRTEISFDIKTTDIDNLLSITSIKLYDGENEVGSESATATQVAFGGLTAGKLYRAEIAFTYDLNDGEGTRTEKTTVSYPTLVESISIEEITLLNNNVVKSGEELNMRIYFINSSEIEMTNIYVNGQKTQVVGGDKISSAIVKFVPKDTGLVEFKVDRVDYTYFNTLVNQTVDSDVSVKYPIYTDLQISYEAVTASPYEYTGGGIYLEFDNSLGYTVYSINESEEFIMLSDNAYYVNADEVTKIAYGYAHFGATTQTLSYSAPKRHTVYGYKEISTAAQFFAMTDGYYILTCDLDLRNETTASQIALTGILYGNGHTVRGLSNVIDTANTEYYALFGGGSIYDVRFTELYISITNANGNIEINPLGDASLYNCTVTGDVLGSANTRFA